MTTPRFIQIHSLHSYPAALINADDSGLAKRIVMGGVTRTRISSQCLKRHWRTADDKYALDNIQGVEESIRSRNTIKVMVIQPLRGNHGIEEEVLDAVEEVFHIWVYGKSASAREDRQTLLLGLPEVEFLRDKAMDICLAHPTDSEAAREAAEALFAPVKTNPEADNFQTFRQQTRMPGGLASALFGRMITADTNADMEGTIHVQHSFTVHAEESEIDYFTSVDDLYDYSDTGGSDYIGESELTAGIFYGYTVVDVPTLVSNIRGCDPDKWLEEDRAIPANVVENLIHLIAKISPASKRGSTAAYSAADLVLVEASDVQPRAFAQAFRKPAEPQIDDTMEKLAFYMDRVDKTLKGGEARKMMSIEEFSLPRTEWMDCDSLGAWVSEVIRKGAV